MWSYQLVSGITILALDDQVIIMHVWFVLANPSCHYMVLGSSSMCMVVPGHTVGYFPLSNYWTTHQSSMYAFRMQLHHHEIGDKSHCYEHSLELLCKGCIVF